MLSSLCPFRALQTSFYTTATQYTNSTDFSARPGQSVQVVGGGGKTCKQKASLLGRGGGGERCDRELGFLCCYKMTCTPTLHAPTPHAHAPHTHPHPHPHPYPPPHTTHPHPHTTQHPPPPSPTRSALACSTSSASCAPGAGATSSPRSSRSHSWCCSWSLWCLWSERGGASCSCRSRGARGRGRR